MESYLKTRREWSAVTGDILEPVFAEKDKPTREERQEHQRWKETRQSAAGTIHLCIDDSQKNHVRDCRDDPKKMWDKLKEIHQQQKAGPRFGAYDAFFNIRKEDDESLVTYTARVSRAMSIVKSLRPTGFTIEQLDEELMCMNTIRGLPSQFSSFVDSLFLIDKLDFSSLQAALHNHESQAQLREATGPAAAMRASAKMPPAGKTSPKVTCTWCKRPGHSEDCYSKRSSKQRDQERWANKLKEKEKNKTENASVTEVKEESASLASIDPLSSASADWNTDTGATRNMTPHRTWFKMYTPHRVPIRLANDSVIFSAGVGLVVFWPKGENGEDMDPVEFHDVLHVPDLRSNLLSPFYLTREKGYTVNI